MFDSVKAILVSGSIFQTLFYDNMLHGVWVEKIARISSNVPFIPAYPFIPQRYDDFYAFFIPIMYISFSGMMLAFAFSYLPGILPFGV